MKPKFSTIRNSSAALLAGVLLAGSAQAAIQVREAALGNGLASNTLTVPVTTANIWSGFQTIEVKDTVTNAVSSFDAFCVDPYQYSSSTFTNYTVANLDTASFSATVIGNITKLYNYAYSSTLGPSAAADANAGALQLALWEVIADSGAVDLYNGNVKAYIPDTNVALRNATDNLLSNYGSYSGPDLYNFTLYKSATNQDFLVATPVPEPETYALMLAGLGLIGLVARRRKQSAR